MYLHLVGSQQELFEDQTELMFDDDVEGFLYRIEDFYDEGIKIIFQNVNKALVKAKLGDRYVYHYIQKIV